LIILIIIVGTWAFSAVLCLALCKAAAVGDRMLELHPANRAPSDSQSLARKSPRQRSPQPATRRPQSGNAGALRSPVPELGFQMYSPPSEIPGFSRGTLDR
jgi:hypothetical protein